MNPVTNKKQLWVETNMLIVGCLKENCKHFSSNHFLQTSQNLNILVG